MIPRILHQVWIGPKPRPARWMDTWRRLHPDWEYQLWDNDRVASFRMINRDKFEATREWCGRADIVRYEILYRYGGFYADADSECLRPLDGAMLDDDAFACYESERFMPGLVASGYLGATRHNPLLGALIERIRHRPLRREPAWQQFGPVLLTATIAELRYEKIRIYPSHYFIPRHYRDRREYAGPGPVYARQFWASTAVGPYGGLGRYDDEETSL